MEIIMGNQVFSFEGWALILSKIEGGKAFLARAKHQYHVSQWDKHEYSIESWKV